MLRLIFPVGTTSNMWSLTQRLSVPFVHSLQALKSASTNSVVPKSRWFSSLLSARCPSPVLSPLVGVSTVMGGFGQLLRPVGSPVVQLVNGFKIKGRLKRRCKDCYFVVRQERHYVMCKSHGRHKQMSMKKSEKNSWILTDATQSKVRQW